MLEDFYFGSFPRVPRGTVVTVGERTFTTDMESDDGATGDLWDDTAGQLPPDLVWPDGRKSGSVSCWGVSRQRARSR